MSKSTSKTPPFCKSAHRSAMKRGPVGSLKRTVIRCSCEHDAEGALSFQLYTDYGGQATFTYVHNGFEDITWKGWLLPLGNCKVKKSGHFLFPQSFRQHKSTTSFSIKVTFKNGYRLSRHTSFCKWQTILLVCKAQRSFCELCHGNHT